MFKVIEKKNDSVVTIYFHLFSEAVQLTMYDL